MAIIHWAMGVRHALAFALMQQNVSHRQAHVMNVLTSTGQRHVVLHVENVVHTSVTKSLVNVNKARETYVTVTIIPANVTSNAQRAV